MPSIRHVMQIKRTCISSCLNCIEYVFSNNHCEQSHSSEDPEINTVRSIFFLSKRLSDKGLARLTHGLDDPCMQQMKRYKLYLCQNRISSRGAHLLSEVLLTSHHIVELSLGNNFIGDEGAECLSIGLEKNAVLQMLNLERNGISCHGVKCLARAVSHGGMGASSLRWLVLSENPVGDKGARALLQCLKNIQSLRGLLENCNHTLFAIVLKKVRVDRSILRDIQCFLKINRLGSSCPGGVSAVAKRKISVCVRDNPGILLDYLVQSQKLRYCDYGDIGDCGMMLKLQPAIFSFFSQDLTTVFRVLRQFPP